MTGNKIIKVTGLAAGVMAAFLMVSAESFAGAGKGGAGNGGQGGGNGGGGHSSDRSDFNFGGHNYDRVVVRRGPVRRHRVQQRKQRRVTRRVQTRTVYTTSWAPGYHCAINNAPVYSKTTCRRAYRLARKGRRYAFADNSGYASYVTIAARRRVIVKRRIVRKRRRVEKRYVIRQRPQQRQRRVIYVDQAPRVIVRRRGTRQRAFIQGGMRYSGYGNNGTTVHYGPLITKQSPY